MKFLNEKKHHLLIIWKQKDKLTAQILNFVQTPINMKVE